MSDVIRELIAEKNDESGALDDLIHDIFSEKASSLNNDALEARLQFLLDTGEFKTEEEILKYLQQY